MLYVTDKYLDYKRTILRKIKNSLNRIESETQNMDFFEARNFLISLGGKNPKYDFGSTNFAPRYHFRPNNIGNAHRVIYSLHDGLSQSTRENFRIENDSFIFFLITDESDHDDRQVKIAKGTCVDEGNFLYRPLASSITNTTLIDGESVDTIESYYGFPIDKNQNQIVEKECPIVIIGSAGSGKTITALELFKRTFLSNKELKVAFVTLTARLRDKVQDELVRCGFPANGCFTFAEFANLQYYEADTFLQTLENIIEFIKSDKYDRGIFNNFCKKYPYLLNKYSIYTIIRGFIKGRLNANNEYLPYQFDNLKDRESMIEDLLKTEEYSKFLGDDTRCVVDYIIKIAEKYQNEKKIPDDNDFDPAPYGQWDCIIVDEVQDLTEKQVDFLIRSCKSNKLYFYGDPNQTINPTFFSFSRLDGIYRKAKNSSCSMNKEQLKETYRSGEYLIKFINHLSDLRKEYIATQSDAWDEHEKSLLKRKDDKWACIIRDEKSLNELFRIFIDSEDCIIIVNDSDEKSILKEKFKDYLGSTELIFPITEIKGLEHKNIIAYNIVSKNKERFDEIFSSNFKKSTIHRMIFNRFYVSLTRAKESIVIVETNIDTKMNKILFEYFDGSTQRIVENVDNDLDLVENYIAKSNNPDAFLRSGDRFLENRYFVQAKEKYNKALELAFNQEEYNHLIQKCQSKNEIIELIVTYYEMKDLSVEYKNEIAEKLVILNEHRFASLFFSELGEISKQKIVEYLRGNSSFSEMISIFTDTQFNDPMLYKYILSKSEFEDDYIATISKMLEE